MKSLIKKLVLCELLILLLFSFGLSVQAEITDINQYNFIATKRGHNAIELLASDKATIISSDDDAVIQFPGGNANNRERSVAELDLSSVSKRRIKYIKFDMTAETFMDLVVTSEPYDISQYTSNRPHNLYLTDRGTMSVTIHSPKEKFEHLSSAEGYKDAIQSKWWIENGHTFEYEKYKTYNIKIIISSKVSPVTVTDKTSGAPISESDEVSVFIDGIRIGEMKKTANLLDAWRNDKLSFIHYATENEVHNLELENLEIGFCEFAAKAKTSDLDANSTEWTFPEGDNVYIRMNVPTDSNSAYIISSPEANGMASISWYKSFGVCGTKTMYDFETDGSCKTSYEEIYEQKNVHTWKNTDEITVTFELDRKRKTIEVYTNLGHYQRGYYETEPTEIRLSNVIGNVRATQVSCGKPTSFDIGIKNSAGETTERFTVGETLTVSASGYAGENRNLLAIYTFSDMFGNIIKIDTASIDSYDSGLFVLPTGFGGEVPENAVEMKVYLWNDICEPLTEVITAKVNNENYENVYSYNVTDVGRYRLTADLGIGNNETDGNIIRVSKNGEMFWEQIMLNGEKHFLDVGLYAENGDVLSVDVGSTVDINTNNYQNVNFEVNRYFVSEERTPDSCIGRNELYVKKMTFSSLIGTTQGAKGTEIYSLKNDKKYPMTYDSAAKRWRSSINNDKGYVDANSVGSGTEWAVGSDTVIETTLSKDGILRLSGLLRLDEKSDGMLVNIYINDKLLWSNRVGGVQAVRWDDPFDTSYFSNNVNAVAKVYSGDKLKFRFNRWKKSGNDYLWMGNLELNYVNTRSDIISKTTKWKLSRSIVVDAKNKKLNKYGVITDIDAVTSEDDILISENDVSKLSNITEYDSIDINGKKYAYLNSVVEHMDKKIALAGCCAVIYDSIEPFIGFSEISEILTAAESDVSLFEE